MRKFLMAALVGLLMMPAAANAIDLGKNLLEGTGAMFGAFVQKSANLVQMKTACSGEKRQWAVCDSLFEGYLGDSMTYLHMMRDKDIKAPALAEEWAAFYGVDGNTFFYKSDVFRAQIVKTVIARINTAETSEKMPDYLFSPALISQTACFVQQHEGMGKRAGEGLGQLVGGVTCDG